MLMPPRFWELGAGCLAWLAARLPGCEVLALDTGHWVMKQRPAEFTALVRAWLERDQPRPSA